ncbi:hypothetical protein A3A01_01030 [Candidatus Nomurabacteria bacterium RIFCSPLOWO2_01_FULL_39_17]|uniref:Uncharacterized protein n=1 Tax=Candidatus Nomurabacteria bacterium RIFCSPLOWO2_01_FULL_39_17 TaxID=1801770 RepID=A0A1F6WX26_9BACT|nr:MAG: hypothetical protein A3A01_01030 [Candidatus Nomurabacteria bacterium RIFCSPLOWO2_01_FULL_39_17]
MPILGVPDIVVPELVHVHLEATVVVDVHVGNEELYDEPSNITADLTSMKMRDRAVFHLGPRSPQAHRTNFYVFCFKKNSLFRKKISGETLKLIFK